MKKPFDFIPEFRDFSVMLNEEFAWQVVNGDVFSVDNMDDVELGKAVLDDVLAVTMWEIQTGSKVHFSIITLCRYLTEQQKTRVMRAIDNVAAYSFLAMSNDSIRVNTNPVMLQAIMDYIEVWYSGFEMPDSALKVDHNKLQKEVEANGGIENYAISLNMELVSTHTPNKTLN
jgi:hypothetical protein